MSALKEKAYNQGLNEILLSLLVLSFPFGSAFLSFSIGFMTIYPYLVILCVLVGFGLIRRDFPTSKLARYYLLFVAALLLYSLAYLPFVENLSYAIIDVRSIILMTLTGYVFISQHDFFGFEKWRQILNRSFKLVFIFICAFGVFEFVSGYHFAGASTDKMIERGLVDESVYSPLFIWDNPNNYFVYVALCGLLILLLENDSRKRLNNAVIIFSMGLFFSIVGITRLGQVISLFGLLLSLLLYGLEAYRHSSEKKPWLIGAGFILIAFCITWFSNKKFDGIPNEHKMRLTQVEPMHPDLHAKYLESLRAQQDSAITPSNMQVPPPGIAERNSDGERKALIKNGIDFIKQSFGLGVGPGQYRHLHDSGQIKQYAYGNNGAHFWLIELVSQFGVVITSMYLLLAGWIFYVLIRAFKTDRHGVIFFALAMFLFMLASMMPSAFLILDIHWIFTAISVMVAAHLLNQSKKTNEI